MTNIIKNQKGITTTTVVVALVAVIAVGGGAAVYIATDGFGTLEEAQTNQTQTETTEETTPEPPSNKALFQSALAGETSIRCEYTKDGQDSTIYLRGDAARINTTTDMGESHFLKTGNQFYIWQAGSNQGFRYNQETYQQHYDEDDYDVYTEEGFQQQNQAGDIECQEDASIDGSLFTAPSGVNFTMPTNQLPAGSGQ